ncbi:hypothetical protein LTR62_000038 [Meristemomyces frigidus]|uniref:Uncharacterized protein n=1 Tax=Meristemomyces frigidus TaxID=1508187 RepID=A0AAN7TS92_9PEZI|nr:hypothetical protein LTR62_000038 [Meristemomyces frigidus]
MPPTLLNLGLPRTGTQSFANALQLLATHPKIYHMREVDQNPGHREKWVQLIYAKYAPGSHLQTAAPDFGKELRELLKGYDACADYPCSLFPIELLKAFPDAKVIITVRDEEAWCRSMQRTLVYPLASQEKAERVNEMRKAYNLYCWGDDFEANGLKYWREHVDLVGEHTAGREVLWYGVREGWKPLCGFLGVEVPAALGFPDDDEARKWGGKATTAE